MGRMKVWTYLSEDGAATAARALPDASSVRRDVVTWRDGWKHPHIAVRESRGIGDVARD
ncbi:hypothetical protein CLV34_2212 [Luteimicrobium subarcticum]|uniref:Uncharacterized protein n=2 Tax=Luteimicrobium subarcticum TaxID=620910 RepID=A0A2M8WJ41_9MICO|nr:hypothetical protein CLV34_2212 [Luteimicrobium subarcticum]